LVHHRRYVHTVAGGLLDPARSEKILAFLLAQGLIRQQDVSRPIAASLANVLRIHSTTYVESLADPRVVGEILGAELGSRQAQEAIDLARLMVGGTIQATRLALRSGRVAVHLGGGLHHATPTEGMGFCIFNDVAVAVARLRARGFTEPILIVDLDLHDGNGTRAAFADDETVFTFSVHNIPWDETPAVASKSVALGSDVTDETFMQVLTTELPAIVASHRPGLVLYVAGVDGATTDVLGDWRLSEEALLARDQFVVSAIRSNGKSPPLVVVLAGGYGTAAWRYTARFLSWLISGDVIEPPDDVQMVLQKFRAISKQWQLQDSTAPEEEDDWNLSPSDLVGLVEHDAARFLGKFSRHAVELQLERLGVLDSIRARGFPNLTVTLDAPSGLGTVLRVLGTPERRDLLLELKASRSRSIVPGFEVLEIEWMLLQNPRGAFTARRAQLPGQSHPGLGMLREVAAWLIVVCEELRLDGIAFVPSQYFMAAVGHRHLQFIDSVRQARFEAIREALGGSRLAMANNLLNNGNVLDRATGAPVYWEPAPMVLPASDRLRASVTGDPHRAKVERARARLSFALRDERFSTGPGPTD
jgi:acetoin utilization deacetylase AcuC-like enzyme